MSTDCLKHFLLKELSKKKTNKEKHLKLQQYPLVLQTLSESQLERYGRHVTKQIKKYHHQSYFCCIFVYTPVQKRSHKYYFCSSFLFSLCVLSIIYFQKEACICLILVEPSFFYVSVSINFLSSVEGQVGEGFEGVTSEPVSVI